MVIKKDDLKEGNKDSEEKKPDSESKISSGKSESAKRSSEFRNSESAADSEKMVSSSSSDDEKKASSKSADFEKTAEELVKETDDVKLANKKKQNKQIMWALILMIAVVAIIFLVPVINNAIFNRFDYNGMVFHKTKLGSIDFYSTNVPLTNTAPVNGSLINKNMITGSFALDLREDPRTSNNINVEIDPKNITFLKRGAVFISLNASDPPCQHNVISAVELTGFLVSFGKINAQGAVVNKEYAELNKVPYVTCETNPDNTVILVANGDEDKISMINKNCYKVEYKECDVLPVTEKFILEILSGYMSYFSK